MWNLAPRLYDGVEGDPVFKLEEHITKPMPKSHQVLLEHVRTVPYNKSQQSSNPQETPGAEQQARKWCPE